jgi:hypothetical protein
VWNCGTIERFQVINAGLIEEGWLKKYQQESNRDGVTWVVPSDG